jgi:hypothetical protein
LESGNDGGFGGGWVDGGGWLFVFEHLVEELGDGAFASGGLSYFGARGEDAQRRVEGDLFYGFGFGGLLFGQVEAGDLETVEEEAGAAGVDVVGGDALEDFADRGLDGGAVFGQGQVEGGAAAAAPAWVGYWFSRGVVVVAELFCAEAWAGAAAAVGEDVAALVLFFWLHVFPPHGVFLCKVFGRNGLGLDLEGVSQLVSESAKPFFSSLRLTAKARLLAGPFVFSIYI